MRFLIGLLAVISVCNLTPANRPSTNEPADHSFGKAPLHHDAHLTDFQAIEFRRYITTDGKRAPFAKYFDASFPEAFRQLGAIATGSFFERKNPNGFTWIRGFHTIDNRAIANAAFDYGPVWAEFKDVVNNLLVDNDNVRLLRPLTYGRGITILPAVDPVTELNGAQGVIVTQIFAVKPGSPKGFARETEPVFATYRAAGA